MGKTSRVYIERELSVQRVSCIREADETDLRVLAALALMADAEGGVMLSEAEAVLGMESGDFRASVKFWRGAGIVRSARAAKPESSSVEREGAKTAHKNGAVAKIVGVEAYTNEELAALLEKRDGASFIDEAQKVLGRIFNKNEVSKLIGLVDQLGFEEEAVLAILSYCVRLEKKSLSYAEKIALTFYDDDICTSSAVHAQIDYLERRNSTVGKIQSLFGFGARKLSTNEKKYFIAWTEEWGFDIEVIKIAYDITVDAIQEAKPSYTNSILKKWYENGLRSAAEVRDFIIEDDRQRQASAATLRTQKQKKGGVEKNAEIEDWFEQRLRQSFGE